MVDIQIGFLLSMVVYSLIPILFVQVVFVVLYFTLGSPYTPAKPFSFIDVESVVIDKGKSLLIEIAFEAKTQYMITRQSLAFTGDGMRIRASAEQGDQEVPYSEIAHVRFGRMRPILLLDAAITFSLAIPITLAINGPFRHWADMSLVTVLAVAFFTLAVCLFLGAFFNSKYIFLEVISPQRGRIGVTARESPAFGMPEARRIAAIVGDMIEHAGTRRN